MNSAEMAGAPVSELRIVAPSGARHEIPGATNLAQGWARLFVHALAENGVRRVVIAPGSRSTPLALAFAASAAVETTVVVDERTAAFAALGMARATGEIAAVLCTSGTAAAHLFPAIVEASEAGHPLLAITADRPWEAQGCGSPQTVDQVRMFGEHVRGFFGAGEPDASPAALHAIARIAAQAAARARGPAPGPVHVNVPFRKPLEPVALAAEEPWESIAGEIAARGVPRAHAAQLVATGGAIEAVARRIAAARRGVIVAGPHAGAPPSAAERTAIARLAERTGFPVLAESTSGLRERSSCVGAFDAFLRVPEIAAALRPDFVLQLGLAPVSPALGAWLADARCPVVAAAGDGWGDPFGVTTEVLPGGMTQIAGALADEIAPRADSAWCDRWRRVDDRAWAAAEAWMRREAGATTGLREPAVVRAVLEALPERGWLLVGNSRPVRDLDSFVAPMAREVAVLHQRGASGIDGLVAGAAGTALARRAPGALLLGDVSLAHDLGSLAAAREVRTPLAIVAVDNGGGRIFDELPLGGREELAAERERLFTTAPRIDWDAAARAFGVEARTAGDVPSLAAALADALTRPCATLVVAKVPCGGTPPRRALHAAVRAALEGWSP